MGWQAINQTMPISWPVVMALVILMLGPGKKTGASPIAPALALLGSFLSLAWTWFLWPRAHAVDLFEGAIRLDNFGLFLAMAANLCAIVTVLASKDYLKSREKNLSEYYALVLFASSGMMIMVMSRNLLSLLFGLEIMSVTFYVLCGFFRELSKSVESAIKYYLTGSFATGLLLFGMALMYGATGTLDLSEVGVKMSEAHISPLMMLGFGFLLAGFGFKVAAVPFHQWLPDVYEGAPTTVTGYMATGVKLAAFGALLRIFMEVYRVPNMPIREILWWLAVLTMTVGNVAALVQKSVKRMLAYSSISHAGYLLVGLVALGGTGAGVGSEGAGRGILFYVFAYALTNLGAFAILAYMERQDGGGTSFDDLAGRRQKFPLASAALTVFMLSLAGIPGTAGFIGKFLIFGSSLDVGARTGLHKFIVLAILGILNSLVGLYYYLRVPIQLYIKPLPEDRLKSVVSPAGRSLTFVMLLTMLGTLWFGFGPNILGVGLEPVLKMVATAMRSLL